MWPARSLCIGLRRRKIVHDPKELSPSHVVTPGATLASHRSYRRVVGGLAAAAVVIGSAAPAFADTIYASAGQVSAAPGGTASFQVFLLPELATTRDNVDPEGCNATAQKKV